MAGTNLGTFRNSDLKQIHDAITNQTAPAQPVPMYQFLVQSDPDINNLHTVMSARIANAITHGWSVKTTNLVFGDVGGMYAYTLSVLMSN